MDTAYQDIQHLLHDAQLLDVSWEPSLAKMRLVFFCLRRNIDGSKLDDPTVELVLDAVERIAAYYSPAAIEVAPSQFDVTSPLTENDLMEWSEKPREITLSLNSRQQEFEMATSCRTDWLFGEPKRDAHSCGFRVYLNLGGYSYAHDYVTQAVYVECGGIQPKSAAMPLDLDQWRQEFDAWWRGWEQHWETKDEADDHSPVIEDAFIPAGSDQTPNMRYSPPRRPAWSVEGSDAPPDLLSPIRDFHEGHHEHDWLKMAHTYPNLDLTESERSEQFKEQYLVSEFGRWVYVCHVDSWWQQGNRACVVIRGIEHSMPDEEDPATNEETVITYGLRRNGGEWIIWTWSQGWPRHGSDPTLEGVQQWRDGWELS